MAELPEVLHRELGADDAVAVDAGDLAPGRAVRDADHVAMAAGELVERLIPAVDVTDDDDAVRV